MFATYYVVFSEFDSASGRCQRWLHQLSLRSGLRFYHHKSSETSLIIWIWFVIFKNFWVVSPFHAGTKSWLRSLEYVVFIWTCNGFIWPQCGYCLSDVMTHSRTAGSCINFIWASRHEQHRVSSGCLKGLWNGWYCTRGAERMGSDDSWSEWWTNTGL